MGESMKILVIRLSSIGDIILTTPVLEELKLKYPSSKLDFVVLDKFEESISGNNSINKLILFEKNRYRGIKGIKAFVEEIKTNDYDLVIDLHSKMRSKLISYFLGVKTYKYKKRKWWKTLLVKLKLIKYKTDSTIIKNYFGAVKELGVEYKGENLKFDFSNKDLLKSLDYKDYIVFAPGASKETKKWCGEYFASLGKMLKEEYLKDIILIGSNSEKKELEKISEMSGGVCINEAGKYTLKESGALMSRAEFVVTNDSGPFHIARGVGTKAYVIFGPTDPKMFEYNEKSILLYGDEKCSPCSLHGDESCRKKHFKCMKHLTPEKVFGIIKKNNVD